MLESARCFIANRRGAMPRFARFVLASGPLRMQGSLSSVERPGGPLAATQWEMVAAPGRPGRSKEAVAHSVDRLVRRRER